MPVFDRYGIERYKEILINQPAGIVSDGGFSTYTLDDPTITPNGTGDFLGVVKTVVLLADVYKETIDTRALSFAQFNNLTQQEFDNYVRQGLILVNRTTNGQPQRIGWVEIGRSYASFYYQSCPGGKRPVSEHYFDIQEFAFNNRIVVGEGSEIEPTAALNPIGNFDPNIGNNLGVLRPRFEPLNLTDYARFALNGIITNNDGETARINNLALTDQTRPSQVSLLMANRGDHFDNEFAVDISIGKWGMVRRTIPESLKPGTQIINQQNRTFELDFSINQGECLQTSVVIPGGTGDDGGPVIITDVTEDPGIYPDLTPDTRRKPEEPPFCEGCPPVSEIPIKVPPLDEKVINPNQIIPYISPQIEDNSTLLRAFYETVSTEENIRDPRQMYLDTENYPQGYTQFLFNKNECEFHLLPSLRDKDGDIPEPIGGVVSYYLEDIREQITNRFYLRKDDNILKELSRGSDGYSSYSDGKSYKELLGESILGCGDYYSFDKIPEIFVEIYPVEERTETKEYREKIERPTNIQWPLSKPDRVHDRNYIQDIIKDLTVGIPDTDFVSDLPNRTSIVFDENLISNFRNNSIINALPVHTINDKWMQAHAPGFHYEPNSYTDAEIDSGILTTSEDQTFRVSRWKSMIRPIYHKIYSDKDEIKDPRWTKYMGYESYWTVDEYNQWNWKNEKGTRYLGKLNSLPWKNEPWKDPHTLGDYDFRKRINGGYGKIIYDKLDDAISLKISTEDISNRIKTLENSPTNSPDIRPMYAYTKLGSIVKYFSYVYNSVYGGGAWKKKNLLAAYDLVFFIGKVIKKGKKFDWSKTLEIDFVEIAIDIVTSVYYSIKLEYSRQNTDRSALEPLRLFKNGGVILRSKSGNYFHEMNPCPIIFLGFNDEIGIKTDLSKLSKNDKEDMIYYKRDNRFYRNKQKTGIRTPSVVSKYIMKQRVKQYGVNPLLDVFYLNIAEKSPEHTGVVPFRIGPDKVLTKFETDWDRFEPAQGLGKKVIDIRMTKKCWPDFSRGQFPSIFPPLWNEPAMIPMDKYIGVNTSPGNLAYRFSDANQVRESLDLKQDANVGDVFWKNRVPNVIIPMEDRWELSLSKDDTDSYAILTDKTPILDIYNQLMEMHVKGISWDEILNYSHLVLNSKTGKKVFRASYNEKIDLKLLEDIHELLKVKLYTINSRDLQNSPIISIPPISWNIVDFDTNDTAIANTKNDRLLLKVLFQSPDIPIYIDRFFIKSLDENIKDVYGNKSSDLFEIDFNTFSNGNPKLNILGLTVSELRKRQSLIPNTWYQFGIRFKLNRPGVNPPEVNWRSIQPMFDYISKLVIIGNKNTPTGEEFETSSLIGATVMTNKKITNTNDLYYEEPLNLPNRFEMGYWFEDYTDQDKKTQTLIFKNHSDSDIIRIKSVDIKNITIYKNTRQSANIIYPKFDKNGNLIEGPFISPDTIFYSDFYNPPTPLSFPFSRLVQNVELQPIDELGKSNSIYQLKFYFNPLLHSRLQNPNKYVGLTPGDTIFYNGIISVKYERKNLLKKLPPLIPLLEWVEKTIQIPITGHTIIK